MIYSFIVVGCETSDTEQYSRQDDPEELIEVIVNYMNEGDELDIFYIKTAGLLPDEAGADYVVATDFFEKVERYEDRPKRENLFVFPSEGAEELTGDALLEAIRNEDEEKFADQIRQHVMICGLADHTIIDRVVRALIENEDQVEVLKDAIPFVNKKVHREAIDDFLEMGANVYESNL